MICKKYKKSQGGFTLIETLVAVMILAAAVVGPLAIAGKGLSTSLVAKDQLTAFYLAQDAIEYIRFVRDTNKLEGRSDWLAGLDGTPNGHSVVDGTSGDCVNPGGGSVGCLLDPIQDTVNSCGSACGALNYDTSNNWFTYTGTGGSVVRSIFTRTVSITNSIAHPDEADVIVTVGWNDVGGIARSVVEREELYNWQP